MKKLMAITLVAASVAMAGSAMAAGSNTLTVQASVTGTCRFNSATSTLDFGALDPAASTNPSATATTQFWCTKGVTTDVISAGNGLHYAGGSRQMEAAGTVKDVIPYSLTLTKDANANTGPGAPRTLTITGGIVNANYINKVADNYSDTVVLNITP